MLPQAAKLRSNIFYASVQTTNSFTSVGSHFFLNFLDLRKSIWKENLFIVEHEKLLAFFAGSNKDLFVLLGYFCSVTRAVL